ncbi:hypothetical protein GH714_009417 [Hevea brasiliensis]|uniref:Peptidase A2 domain-containing protein n=1 Tax=Hevea brasiliensis TaxID=3981 RepID=A0A6A6L0R4_HEVBR|nr:hypothetical protein GH714_009417 [Hevea brasiliensis]
MKKLAVRIEALEKRVEEILAWVNEKPTREELTRELELVYLIVEQRDKHIEWPDMEDLTKSLKSIIVSHNSLVGAVDDMKEDVRETVNTIQGKLHELKGKVNLLIRATSNPSWGLMRLKIVPMYLTDDVKLWCVYESGRNYIGAVLDWCIILRAIREEEKGLKGKEQREDDNTPLMVGAILFLGALEKQKWKPSIEKGLIYVDLWINGKAARALVDTGATDNFIANTTALQFQLNMQEDTGKIKAVNYKAANIVGVAHRISCQMGSWNGEIDFTVIPLNDFDVVIGMEFLKKAQAIPIPIVNCLLLMGRNLALFSQALVPFVKRN